MKGWAYKPDLPLGVSPVWSWPPRPIAALRWFWDGWFFITVKLAVLGIAVLAWLFATPSLEITETLAPGWVAAITLRNLVTLIAVAGPLHLYFYRYRAQGDTLKYDARPLGRGRVFTLGSQVRDNMFWSCTSGVIVWSAYEALMLWSIANGHIALMNFDANPFWFLAIFFLIPIWESFYFYWVHRWLHWPPLYKLAHALHHRNTNIGPWSGLSMHPIEHVIYLGSVLIHFILPTHPLHIVFHLFYYTLTAVTTHTGFEGLFVRNKKRLSLGTFHHQMHHRYFECNYGSLELPWDRWFGSWHDGTPEAHEIMKERRKRMHGK